MMGKDKASLLRRNTIRGGLMSHNAIALK